VLGRLVGAGDGALMKAGTFLAHVVEPTSTVAPKRKRRRFTPCETMHGKNGRRLPYLAVPGWVPLEGIFELGPRRRIML